MYLGVDTKYKRQGFAAEMLDDLFTIAYELIENTGCNFIYLDCNSELGHILYEDRGFRTIDYDEEIKMWKMVFKIERQ